MNPAAKAIAIRLIAVAIGVAVAFPILYFGGSYLLVLRDRRAFKRRMRALQESAEYARPRTRVDFSLKGLAVPSPYRRQLHRLKPNLTGYYAHAFVRTNKHGFRGPDYPTAKGKNTFRLALLGDSHAFGQSIDDEAETIAGALEYLLNCSDGPIRSEVLNFGIPGLDASAIAATLRNDALNYAPDVLLYLFNMGGLEIPYEMGEEQEAEPRRKASRIGPWLERRFAHLLAGLGESGIITKTVYIRDWHVEADWQRFGACLRDMRAAAGAVPIMMILDYTELLAPKTEYKIHHRAAELASSHGMIVCDTYDRYSQFLRVYDTTFNPALQISRDDAHPNRRRAALIATATLEALVQENLVPDRQGLCMTFPSIRSTSRRTHDVSHRTRTQGSH